MGPAAVELMVLGMFQHNGGVSHVLLFLPCRLSQYIILKLQKSGVIWKQKRLDWGISTLLTKHCSSVAGLQLQKKSALSSAWLTQVVLK